MNQQLRVGVITKTHGLRGEVKVYPTTDSPHRFDDLDRITLKLGKTQLKLRIESVRYFKNLVILKFKGIDDINDIEKYRGAELYIDRKFGAELEENEYYLADIIGIDVVTDSGESLGTVTDVLQTGANDVYVVKRASGKDILLPAIKECILDVNTADNVMKIHLMEGLLDL